MNSEWYLNPIGGYGLATALAVIMILLLTFVGLPRHRLTPRRRLWLAMLRLGVIVLAMFAMWRPTLVYTRCQAALRHAGGAGGPIAEHGDRRLGGGPFAVGNVALGPRRVAAGARRAGRKHRGQNLRLRRESARDRFSRRRRRPRQTARRPANRHRRRARGRAPPRSRQTAGGPAPLERRRAAGLRAARSAPPRPGPAVGRPGIRPVHVSLRPGPRAGPDARRGAQGPDRQSVGLRQKRTGRARHGAHRGFWQSARAGATLV